MKLKKLFGITTAALLSSCSTLDGMKQDIANLTIPQGQIKDPVTQIRFEEKTGRVAPQDHAAAHCRAANEKLPAVQSLATEKQRIEERIAIQEPRDMIANRTAQLQNTTQMALETRTLKRHTENCVQGIAATAQMCSFNGAANQVIQASIGEPAQGPSDCLPDESKEYGQLLQNIINGNYGNAEPSATRTAPAIPAPHPVRQRFQTPVLTR
ncbi:MAG: hypothetical protein R3E13_02350 [Alphaproteobacteria bacterium]